MTLILRVVAFGVGVYFTLAFLVKYRLGPRTHHVRRTKGLRVPMPDGVELSTDVFEALGADGPCPTLLMRLPYGRDGFAGIAAVYAARGFNVVVQACRGTEDSGGRFNPLTHERADGLATLAWIKAQPWFDGRLGLTGPSYLGFAQWAIADAPEVKAMAVKVSSSEFRSVVFPGGAFHLGLWLSWIQTIEGLKNAVLFSVRMFTGDIERRTLNASFTLPLIEADIAAAGHRVWFWREWFETAIADGPFWREMDHRDRAARATAPIHLMSGWYDFMLDQLLADYRRLLQAGRPAFLTISSSTHITGGHDADNPAETLAWMRAHLRGDFSGLRRKPVRIEISGAGWREFDVFPPPGARPEGYFLAEAGRLGSTPAAAPPSRYRYDPADPTPNLGGAIFAFHGAGPVPQRRLDGRKDTLCFTSAAVLRPKTLIGNPTARIFLRASLPFVDLFVRLSDVDRRGRSINICDGFLRLTPEAARDGNGIMAVDLRLHASAHCFRAGHRLRVLVASGAHPRYARNPGTGEPPGEAITLRVNDIEIFHDLAHRSALTLPLYDLA